MKKRVYKKVTTESGGTLTFYGGRVAMLHDGFNKDIGEFDSYFMHYGTKYWLSDFMITGFSGPVPKYMREFDGYANDSLFSGVVVKVDHDNYAVRAYTFIV